MTKKVTKKSPDIVLLGSSNQHIAYPDQVVLPESAAGNFWTLGVLAENKFTPPAYGFVNRQANKSQR